MNFLALSVATQDVPESSVKAALIYNLAKFITWPSRPQSTDNGKFTICLMGEEPFLPDIDDIIRGKTVEGKTLVSRRVSKVLDANECKILIISSSESERLTRILRPLAFAPVLTVGESTDFTERGGIIRFFITEGRVRFEVNLNALERTGLKLSSQVLTLGQTVRY